MRSLGSSTRDLGREDSPARNPTSAYVPSSSAPWMTNTATGPPASGGVGAGLATSGYKSPSSVSGSSWWDKHASGQATPASNWGRTGGIPVSPEVLEIVKKWCVLTSQGAWVLMDQTYGRGRAG